MEGYNIRLKLNSKYLLGCTSDSLTISAKTKESITKADQGVTRKAVTGHDVKFSTSALVSLNEDGTTTDLDRDDIIALALAKGNAAVIPVEYGPAGGDIYQGNAIITNFSESSEAAADNDATISIDCEVVGELTKKTV